MDNQRAPRNYSNGTVKRDNRQQQQKLVVILICIVIALLLVVFMTIIGTKIVLALAGGFDNGNPDDVQYTEVTVDKNQTLYGPLALVNSTHEYKFPAAAETNLLNIWGYRTSHTPEGKTAAYKTSYTTYMLDGVALSAMHEWLTAFNKETGETFACITSAYRSLKDQEDLALISPSAVTPGKSDHHTGYSIALKILDNENVTLPLSSNETYNWLSENAYKYGLIVRYPQDKETITAISDYTNCFHYVGYGPAMYMHENNLCLEEFVAQIKSYSVDKPLAVTDANGQKWLIYYTACPGDMATVQVPTNFTYTMSGDNEGGIIICVSLSKSAAEQQQQESDTADQ
ncbi:MAG: D-alanyl-D-alanine carboxypeptidase family protein [Clostridia bacterium]|nr:D-alanyl-D-alanine carboxypeptidase family protein [Clostridia bacterium]